LRMAFSGFIPLHAKVEDEQTHEQAHKHTARNDKNPFCLCDDNWPSNIRNFLWGGNGSRFCIRLYIFVSRKTSGRVVCWVGS
jgi:hypothetical protein